MELDICLPTDSNRWSSTVTLNHQRVFLVLRLENWSITLPEQSEYITARRDRSERKRGDPVNWRTMLGMRVVQFFLCRCLWSREPPFNTKTGGNKKSKKPAVFRCTQNGKRLVHRRVATTPFVSGFAASSGIYEAAALTRDQIRWPTILHVHLVSV